MKWWKIKILAVYVMVTGLVVELILGASLGFIIYNLGCTLVTIGANVRVREMARRSRRRK